MLCHGESKNYIQTQSEENALKPPSEVVRLLRSHKCLERIYTWSVHDQIRQSNQYKCTKSSLSLQFERYISVVLSVMWRNFTFNAPRHGPDLYIACSDKHDTGQRLTAWCSLLGAIHTEGVFALKDRRCRQWNGEKGKALNRDVFCFFCFFELDNYYAWDTAKHPSAIVKHVSLARLHRKTMKK